MSQLEQIYNTFSAGRKPDDKSDFSASKMYSLLEDPFGIWCDFHAPADAAVVEINRYENLKIRTDRSNKDSWILTHYPETVFIKSDRDVEEPKDRFYKTLEAMAAGAQAIAGAALWDLPENVFGSANLLVKQNSGQSVFGPYHYTIVQLKRANDIKEHYSLQIALINKILGRIQGLTPLYAKVVLSSKTMSVSYLALLERLEREINIWKEIKAGAFEPEAHKPPKASSSPWRIYANKVVTERKDLLMLPHLSPEMRRMLRAAGFNNTDEIANSDIETLRTVLEEPFATETFYTSLAYLHHKPVLREKGLFPPARKKHNLYFDFEATETFTKDNESFVYLIGIWDKEENKFVSFVAKTKEEEEKIFAQFFDYIKDFEDTILYHWTEYEVKKMRSLASKYPAIAAKLNALANICFDLKILIGKAFYLPAPSLSLKAAAPAFGFNWRQGDCGAMDSMVYYTNWIKTGHQELIDKVLMYNEDDCIAMLYLDEKLQAAEVIDPPKK
ncbi:uncharacterized protein Dip510_001768 [Elusimicrobium posterum]|uniref:TM0106 family RecB-like putative nuclease n=1 Tax=Elusimicrobium posterum TaxID=3116653 RepID=UPI003C7948FF